MKIFITGGTGMIGQAVGRRLAARGHELFVLSRGRPDPSRVSFPCTFIQGDLSQAPLAHTELDHIQAVIHLMGESIAQGRWTASKKRSIYDSRVLASKNLLQSFKAPPSILISGSAVGFYGDRASEELREDAKAGSDFLARVCQDWEQAAADFSGRKVFIRTGMVLSAEGGALPRMIKPFLWGLGGPLGDGHQYMSWIHLEDLAALIVFALENDQVAGPLNGVAPQTLTNRDFSQALAHCVGKRLAPAVPQFLLKIALGEMSDMLLASQKVLADKALALGFEFSYPRIDDALRDLCPRLSKK